MVPPDLHTVLKWSVTHRLVVDTGMCCPSHQSWFTGSVSLSLWSLETTYSIKKQRWISREQGHFIRSPVQLLVNTNIESANHIADTQCRCKHGQDDLLKFKLSIRWFKWVVRVSFQRLLIYWDFQTQRMIRKKEISSKLQFFRRASLNCSRRNTCKLRLTETGQ